MARAEGKNDQDGRLGSMQDCSDHFNFAASAFEAHQSHMSKLSKTCKCDMHQSKVAELLEWAYFCSLSKARALGASRAMDASYWGNAGIISSRIRHPAQCNSVTA